MRVHLLYHLAIILGPYLVIWAVSLLTMELIPHCLTTRAATSVFRVYHDSVPLLAARRRNSALPLKALILALCLNTFRGEPASSGFDWHFTPNHSSSADFATSVGSGLHLVLPKLHPGHG
jgi:phosphatidylglycerophosphate synthase